MCEIKYPVKYSGITVLVKANTTQIQGARPPLPVCGFILTTHGYRFCWVNSNDHVCFQKNIKWCHKVYVHWTCLSLLQNISGPKFCPSSWESSLIKTTTFTVWFMREIDFHIWMVQESLQESILWVDLVRLEALHSSVLHIYFKNSCQSYECLLQFHHEPKHRICTSVLQVVAQIRRSRTWALFLDGNQKKIGFANH